MHSVQKWTKMGHTDKPRLEETLILTCHIFINTKPTCFKFGLDVPVETIFFLNFGTFARK